MAFLVASHSFQFRDTTANGEGLTYTIREGERVDVTHPAVVAHPGHFAPDSNPVATGDQRARILANLQRGSIESPPADRDRTAHQPRDTSPGAEHRDAALRTIERHSDHLNAPGADRLDELARRTTPGATLEQRYMTAVGNPAYKDWFSKLMVYGESGVSARATREEIDAAMVVQTVESERAFAVGATTTGSFAIPFDLDPTILLNSNGALNPIRQLARTFTTSSTTWQGVTSAGATAEYAQEASEVADASFTIGQAAITPQRGDVTVLASLETIQDWSGFESEMRRVMLDAKDQLEATKFMSGSGTNEPQGLLVGGTLVVTSGATGGFAVADVYATKQAVPARWMAQASWLAHPTTLDTIWQMVKPGDVTNAPLMTADRANILGRSVAEITTMAAITGTTAQTTGALGLVYGSIADSYYIVDRIGAQLEIIPALGSNRRPSGQRWYAMWFRTGAAVVIPNAIRVLKVK